MLNGEHAVWALVLVASLGNTLGSVVNWALGRAIHRFRDRPWFPASPAAMARAEGWYRRWGYWSLMLSWAPIIGDHFGSYLRICLRGLGNSHCFNHAQNAYNE